MKEHAPSNHELLDAVSYPLPQPHTKLPGVLLHITPLAQVLVPSAHSSLSAQVVPLPL